MYQHQKEGFAKDVQGERVSRTEQRLPCYIVQTIATHTRATWYLALEGNDETVNLTVLPVLCLLSSQVFLLRYHIKALVLVGLTPSLPSPSVRISN